MQAEESSERAQTTSHLVPAEPDLAHEVCVEAADGEVVLQSVEHTKHGQFLATRLRCVPEEVGVTYKARENLVVEGMRRTDSFEFAEHPPFEFAPSVLVEQIVELGGRLGPTGS